MVETSDVAFFPPFSIEFGELRRVFVGVVFNSICSLDHLFNGLLSKKVCEV